MSSFATNRLKRDRYINPNVFIQLFEVAQITSFSQEERDAYENSLKYYRDMKGVIETAREEGREEGKRSLLLKQLSRKLGNITDETKIQLHQLRPELLDTLSEALFDLEDLEDLDNWLKNIIDPLQIKFEQPLDSNHNI
jgi:hypothetical protein